MSAPLRSVILAGGQGARFWPVSRLRRPKQFLSVSSDGESLIASSARRAERLSGRKNVLIITNVLHKAEVTEHVPYARILCEPVGRNTAASIGLAAVALRREGGDPVMVILPADHAVESEDLLIEALREGAALAQARDLLVTIGIPPTRPHTGYGYICRGAKIPGAGDRCFEVARFYEKPSLERARKYLETGNFFWNGGMFVVRASVMLNAIAAHMPELYDGLCRIEAALGSSAEAAMVETVFADLDSISVDFGVLEHARNCAVVAAPPFGWDDVGSWESWAGHFAKDACGNVGQGDVLVLDGRNNVVHTKSRLVALLGVDDLVVIDTEDAVLVCPRGRAQDVRRVVEELKKKGRDDLV